MQILINITPKYQLFEFRIQNLLHLYKTPPKNDNLNKSESDLYDMVQNIEFEKVKSIFQMQLSNVVKNW